MYRFLILIFGMSLAASAVHAKQFIGGTTPDVRPANAPVTATVEKNTEWYTKALQGVIPPYPASLRFLEDQGNWYTPFSVPGMHGPYDIRDWHSIK